IFRVSAAGETGQRKSVDAEALWAHAQSQVTPAQTSFTAGAYTYHYVQPASNVAVSQQVGWAAASYQYICTY
ncbi:hypothetical protein HaLaN_21757, partial [Haematococcus lacustris]